MGEPEKKSIAAAAAVRQRGEDGTRRDSLLLIETDRVNSFASMTSCSSSCGCMDDPSSVSCAASHQDDGSSSLETCPVCQHLSRKRYELRKHHKAVIRKLMSHRKISHPEIEADSMSSPKSKSENNHLDHEVKTPRPKERAAVNNVSGELGDSHCHFPFMQNVRTSVNPPKPRVRRLIGEQAKMIGRKIDSSNLQFALSDYSS